MNQPLSRIRLLILAVLLVVEVALVISLRNSGWLATGNSIRSLMIAIASILPFFMAAVLLYQVRISLRHGQFSLRALMALTLVVASFLTLYSFSAKPKKPNIGPLPISKSVKLEVFIVAVAGTANGTVYTDTNTGDKLRVTNPPIVTTTDVSTVQLIPREDGQGYEGLLVTLNPISGNNLLKATTAAKGSKLVVVVDGQALATPKISSPVGHQFQLSGGRINSEGIEVFKKLTER
jgi:hypothetical protein